MYEVLLASRVSLIDSLLEQNDALLLLEIPDKHVLCDVCEIKLENEYVSYWKLYKLTFDNLISLLGQKFSSVMLGSRVCDGDAWGGFYTDDLGVVSLDRFWEVYREAGIEFPPKNEEEVRFGRTVVFERKRFRRGQPNYCRRGYVSVGAI